MNVETITMDAAEARNRLEEYRDHRRTQVDAEYAAARAGYEALTKGYQLLDLDQVFLEAPVDGQGRPMLAIARADRKEVEVGHCLRWSGGSSSHRATFDARARWSSRRSETLYLSVPTHGKFPRGQTTVPLVPPKAKGARRLDRHFVLWEVESWEDVPPVDPFLLRPLTGSLYVIVAAWDLTELERAIIRRRTTT